VAFLFHHGPQKKQRRYTTVNILAFRPVFVKNTLVKQAPSIQNNSTNDCQHRNENEHGNTIRLFHDSSLSRYKKLETRVGYSRLQTITPATVHRTSKSTLPAFQSFNTSFIVFSSSLSLTDARHFFVTPLTFPILLANE